MPSAFRSLCVESLSKSFSGVNVVRDVSFRIEAGQAVGLIGENGAGKTTLMNCLTGLYRPDKGIIRINDDRAEIRRSRDAFAFGIGMVHQHFMLVPTLSVLENIVLGLDRSTVFRPVRTLRDEFTQISRRFGLEVDPDVAAGELAPGEQQRVEIVRILMRGARLLILDEPTSVLSPSETDSFFDSLRRLISEGCAVLLVSHKLDEILTFCSRILVLRRGRIESDCSTDGMDMRTITKKMIGNAEPVKGSRIVSEPGPVILEVRDLAARNDRGIPAVQGITFEMCRGEIFGIAGISGNGQRELASVLAGVRKAERGMIRFDGEDITRVGPRGRLERGIAWIPEDRLHEGSIGGMTVGENAVLRSFYRAPYARSGWIRKTVVRSFARSLTERFAVVTPSLDTPVRWLSGGNIQKLIAGRELSGSPRMVIASHPTYGLDVRAAEAVRSMLLHCRDQGGGVLLLSADLDELLEISSRIAVIFRGRLMGIMDHPDMDRQTIGLWMTGV